MPTLREAIATEITSTGETYQYLSAKINELTQQLARDLSWAGENEVLYMSVYNKTFSVTFRGNIQTVYDLQRTLGIKFKRRFNENSGHVTFSGKVKRDDTTWDIDITGDLAPARGCQIVEREVTVKRYKLVCDGKEVDPNNLPPDSPFVRDDSDAEHLDVQPEDGE